MEIKTKSKNYILCFRTLRRLNLQKLINVILDVKKFSSSVEQRQHITRHEYKLRKNDDEGIGSDFTGDESDFNKEIVC